MIQDGNGAQNSEFRKLSILSPEKPKSIRTSIDPAPYPFTLEEDEEDVEEQEDTGETEEEEADDQPIEKHSREVPSRHAFESGR